MSSTADKLFPVSKNNGVRAAERRRRDLLELGVGYGLILAALWTPRPWQFVCDWTALAWVLVSTIRSFDGWTVMGLRERGFARSLWVAGVALLLAVVAVAVSARLHTLHAPDAPLLFVRRFWTYGVWAVLQEFLLLDFFLLRLLRLLPNKTAAVLTTVGLFTLAHIPNPVLMPLVVVWGSVACAVFLRYRNVYTLGLAHAVLGICVAITVPGRTDHNMRVGLGYLTYRPYSMHHHWKKSPQSVSTVAWVSAEAPTRRSLRQARP
ncbi:MAG TPA: CPBP family intramembrane glutamic endopeptidase [Acidobacteriaceae bacterium]|nr:CPBP family intramembrane glutamic endopeptidase [Acidobacteriaceae bacterium]